MIMHDTGSYVDYLDEATWHHLVGGCSTVTELRSSISILRRSSLVQWRVRMYTGLPAQP